jgi:hypothetical protein
MGVKPEEDLWVNIDILGILFVVFDRTVFLDFVVMHLSMLTPRVGGLGKGWGFDIFTKKNVKCHSLGRENSWAKFHTPGMKLYS